MIPASRMALYLGSIDGEFLGDDAMVQDPTPGAIFSFRGRRYEIIRVLFHSGLVSTFPGCCVVKAFQ